MSAVALSYAGGSKNEADELDKETLELVHRVILRSTKTKKKYFENWKRSQLLNEGYSELVVAKAEQHDSKEQVRSAIFSFFAILPILSCNYGTAEVRSIWAVVVFFLILLLWFLRSNDYKKHKKLSYSDNLLVLKELKEKLDPPPLPKNI